MVEGRIRREKARRQRARRRRLRPIRGAAGRRLRQTGLGRGRVVSLSRFASGLGRPRRTPKSRLVGFLLASVPVIVIVVFVVARLTRHL